MGVYLGMILLYLSKSVLVIFVASSIISTIFLATRGRSFTNFAVINSDTETAS